MRAPLEEDVRPEQDFSTNEGRKAVRRMLCRKGIKIHGKPLRGSPMRRWKTVATRRPAPNVKIRVKARPGK